MLKILIVDDDHLYQEMYRDALGEKVLIIEALSIEKAEEHFLNSPDIVAIIMDACVPGGEPTTLPLVKKFRETFTGPIIASSGSTVYRKMLMFAGCDYEADKWDVPKKVLEILGL